MIQLLISPYSGHLGVSLRGRREEDHISTAKFVVSAPTSLTFSCRSPRRRHPYHLQCRAVGQCAILRHQSPTVAAGDALGLTGLGFLERPYKCVRLPSYDSFNHSTTHFIHCTVNPTRNLQHISASPWFGGSEAGVHM